MELILRNLLFTCIFLLQNVMQVDSNPVTILGNQMQIVELKNGDIHNISCRSNMNSSASEITWQFNGKPLNQTPKVEGSLSILPINMTSFNQSGKYSCGFANNKELWENISITFGRKPSSVKNLTCVEFSEHEYNCTWLPGDVDTNLPASVYLFEYSADQCFKKCTEYTQDLYIHKSYDKKITIEISAENDLGQSEEMIFIYTIKTFAPVNVTGSFLNDTTLSVNWDIPHNHLFKDYNIMYREMFPKNTSNWTVKENQNRYERPNRITVHTGYNEYEVKVRINHEKDEGAKESDSIMVKKNETNPTGNVNGNCKWKDDNAQIIICYWEALPIEKHNGRLLGYNVSVFNQNNKKKIDTVAKHSNESLKTEFKDLETDVDYNVEVTAYNSAGYSTIFSTSVAQKPTTGIGKGYIALIVCLSTLILVCLLLILVQSIKKANFMTPFPEPKFFYKSQWETTGCSDRGHNEVEIFDEIKTKNAPKEKGDTFERTFMLPEKDREAVEVCHLEDDQQKMEVTNLTYLIMGRKREQQNINVFQTDIIKENLEEINSYEENSDDTNVCYLRLRSGNLLTQVANNDHDSSAVISEAPSLCVDPPPSTTGSVPYSEEGYESFLINKSTLPSSNYISGSGTSCRTADTQLSSS